MIRLCRERGIHISFVTNNWTDVDYHMAFNNLLPLIAPKEVSTYKSEGGRLVAKRFNWNLNQVYEASYTSGQNFTYYDFHVAYLAYLQAQGIPAADIYVSNNVSQ